VANLFSYWGIVPLGLRVSLLAPKEAFFLL
jgi:hypothetical protein